MDSFKTKRLILNEDELAIVASSLENMAITLQTQLFKDHRLATAIELMAIQKLNKMAGQINSGEIVETVKESDYVLPR